MRSCLAALLTVACGEVHFVDPNPPALYRATARFQPGSIDEPVVWMTVLDLFVEQASACADTRQGMLEMVRAAFSALPAQKLELPSQDLAPGCRQRGEVPLDVDAATAAFSAARAAFPGAHVRPVIVYVDDIDLPLPPQLTSSLQALRQPPVAGSKLTPLLWTMAVREATASLAPDEDLGWTFTGDPALAALLGLVVKRDLPLQTLRQPGPMPLLDAAQLAVTREVKVCREPTDVPVLEGPAPGVAVAVDPAHGPTMLFDVPETFAVPKGFLLVPQTEILIEGCTANCDRFYVAEPGDEPRRWNGTRHCMLRATST